MIVSHEEGDRFQVSIRGHQLSVDQPVDHGGTDEGPTPTEVFVAGLASCVAFYAERYLRRHDLPIDGLLVDCSFAFAEDRPTRVASVTLHVDAPGLPASRRAGFLAVIERCTVHNSLRIPPDVRIELDPIEAAA
jgi:uncharacterized OsmC-like protein